MTPILGNLSVSFRSLARRPAFAVVAILALGLGIGAAVTVFSVVDTVLVAPLPFGDPDELLWISRIDDEEGLRGLSLSSPDFLDLKSGADAFSGMASMRDATLVLTDAGPATTLTMFWVSDGFLSTLGLSPVAGRDFGAEDFAPDAGLGTMVSETLWRERFGADPGLMGRTVRLDGIPVPVLGVFPDEVDFLGRLPAPDLLIPELEKLRPGRFSHSTRAIGRLAPGASVELANEQLDGISRRLAEEYPDSNSGKGAAATPLVEELVGEARPALRLLLAAVAALLLIATANVANMLLARGVERREEMEIRRALGAGRGALAGLFLIEGAVLGFLGGLLGLGLASWTLELIVRFAPGGTPRLDEVALGPRAALFALAAALATGLAAGCGPATLLGRLRAATSLRGGRSVVGGDGRLRTVLLVGEIATCLVLLVAAALLARSFAHLLDVDPGFRPEGVAVFDVELVKARYAEEADIVAGWERLIASIEAIPGVASVGATSTLPYGDTSISIDLWPLLGEPMPEVSRAPSASFHTVFEGYFSTLGMSLERGRTFGARDDGEPRTIVVNEALASRHFPGRDAIGQRMLVNLFPDTQESEAYEVIGIVGNVRQKGFHVEPAPEMYVAQRQWKWRFQTIVVRAAEGFEADALFEPIRRTVEAFDPALPVRVRTLSSFVDDHLAQRRFLLALLAGFALLALVLASVGIYGVVSTTVGRRVREISVRMALGADRRQILGQILGEVATTAAVGIAIGLVGAFLLRRFLDSMVVGIGVLDPTTWLGVAVVLGASAVGAALPPARRATRVDPMVLLRDG